MGYGIGGIIENEDFNAFINGGTTGSLQAPAFTVPVGLNTVWSTGAASFGYGQATLTPVVGALGSPTSTIRALNAPPAGEWNQFFADVFATANHQGTVITLTPANARHVTVTAGTMPPTVNRIITWENNMQATLALLAANRLNCAAQAAQFSGSIASAAWGGAFPTYTLTVTRSINFPSTEAARFFFNTGGQTKIQFSYPPGVAGSIDEAINVLCSSFGTLVLSAPGNGAGGVVTASYPLGTYTGSQKDGGSGASTVSTNTGFHALTAGNQTLMSHTGAGGDYSASSIVVQAALVGSSIQYTATITINDTDPSGANPPPSGALTATAIVVPPSPTFLTQVSPTTWTPTIS